MARWFLHALMYTPSKKKLCLICYSKNSFGTAGLVMELQKNWEMSHQSLSVD
jgi:hypothetical protein